MANVIVKETQKKPEITTDDVGGVVNKTVEFSDNNETVVLEDTSKDFETDISLPKHLRLGTPGGDMYLKELKFFEEPVSFMIGDSMDPNDEKVVQVAVNCESYSFERNKVYTVPRKIVNGLLVRSDRVETVNYKDTNGVDQTKIQRRLALKYPIQIVEDKSPMGMAWFKWQCEHA